MRENVLYGIAALAMIVTGCTLSFQNIDTHGETSDLVDEQQSASPNVAPEVSVPISPVK